MPTGACGIHCDVCRLNVLGICSTCGSGKSDYGLKKMDAQERILGRPCPVLACAVENSIEYCPRDCDRFPCDEFRSGPYPFSEGYLNMQERRRKSSSSKTPSGKPLEVPIQYWEDLTQKNMKEICENTLAIHHPQGLLLPFLKEYLLIHITNQCLFRQSRNQLEHIKNPLLQLLCLVYLLNAGPESLHDEMISVHELKTAHFFRGPHELKIRPILDRYGNDLSGFKRAAEAIGGDAVDMADMGYKFSAFPKVPLYYLLWKGDPEFGPSASILFDRSIEHHFNADAIWGLTQLISDTLLVGDIRAVFQMSS